MRFAREIRWFKLLETDCRAKRLQDRDKKYWTVVMRCSEIALLTRRLRKVVALVAKRTVDVGDEGRESEQTVDGEVMEGDKRTSE